MTHLCVYTDACTFYVVAVIVALTLGQIGPSTEAVPNFLTQIYQVTPLHVQGNISPFPVDKERVCLLNIMMRMTHLEAHV